MSMVNEYGSAGWSGDVKSAVTLDGELDNRRYRLNDVSARLGAVLDNAQTHIDRRYGGSPVAGAIGANTCPPSRAGSVGAMDDTIDRLEALVDRAGGLIATLGAL